MSHKELRIAMDELGDAQTITDVNRRHFAKAFGSANAIHHQEVDELIDDYDRKERILKVRGVTKYFVMGR